MNRYIVFVFMLLFCTVAFADTPQLVNAKIVNRSVTKGLQNEVNELLKAPGPAWITYSVPVISGEHHMCCYSSENVCNGCTLEKKEGTFSAQKSGTAKLEAGDQLAIYLRANGGRIEKVRAFSSDCQIDAGGLTVYSLSDVRPNDSIAFLASLADPSAADGRGVLDGAIMAIAFHADASADTALDRLVAVNQPASMRKKAAFWIGQVRGSHGLQTLLNVMRNDPDDKLRSEFIFPISQSKEANAVTELIRIAREDRSSHVRSQALFWLAQKAGQKVQATLTEAAENDPDTQVKRQAVFAISQLPADQGVPILIQLAKTNRNSVVRKQAMFWLGQSHDPRALDFIAEILSH